MEAAIGLPYCRFNIPYEEWDNPRVQSAVMAHLAGLKQLYQLLALRAEAEMVAGHSDLALKDMVVMFRIDDGLKDEPILISQLVRMAGMAYLLRPIGEGLAEHRWSTEQLQVLQDCLGKCDLMASTVMSSYGERDICWNPSFDRGYMRLRGWNRLEQLNLNRAFNQTVLPRIDLVARVINPRVNHSMDLAVPESLEGNSFGNRFSALLHHNIMARMTLPAYSHVGEKAALAQSGVDIATVACALERYRLAMGQCPAELSALVPRFASALPHDIINGQPLKYRRTDNGRFILYSVGWNEKDDGGVVATKGNPPRQDNDQGDWVWQIPGKTVETVGRDSVEPRLDCGLRIPHGRQGETSRDDFFLFPQEIESGLDGVSPYRDGKFKPARCLRRRRGRPFGRSRSVPWETWRGTLRR